jgi:hypothetical protein
MKRIRLLVLLGAVAVALPLGLTTAKATGTTNSVSIRPYADFNASGTSIDIGLDVRCTGTSVVEVTLQQWPPETGSPVSVAGLGPQPLVSCDGNSHYVGVTVTGVGFDTGQAKATATLYGGSLTGPVKAKSTRWVEIRHR